MFQFQCPGGHLLEGDESQAGQKCQCPMCNILFIIPQPVGGAADQATSGPQQGGSAEGSFPSLIGPPGGRASGIGPADDQPVDPMAPVSQAPQSGFSLSGQQSAAPAGPLLYHIPCPNGHELEVPEEMLRQDVLCPFCEAQFHLRMKDSVEYKKQKQEEQEKKDRKAGKNWLNGSIAIAVVVLLGLVIMIVASSG
jgi:hypothetical protein